MYISTNCLLLFRNNINKVSSITLALIHLILKKKTNKIKFQIVLSGLYYSHNI